MRVGVGNAAITMGSSPMRAPPGSASAEFEQALARLDELLRHLPRRRCAALQRRSTARRLSAQHAALAASAGTPAQRQVIELVSRVFDAIVADPQVCAGFRPVIARLRAAALARGIARPRHDGSPRHAVWQLLDRIGEIGHRRAAGRRPAAVGLLRCARRSPTSSRTRPRPTPRCIAVR